MSRLRLAVTALVLAVFAGVVGMQILVSPSVVSADIGGGRAGPRGATGRTGPTGPNWTTCAELASSMTNEVGTCGSLGGPLLSASPTTTGTLTAAGISAVTGVLSGVNGSTTLTVSPGGGIQATISASSESASFGAIYGSTANGIGVFGQATGTGSGVYASNSTNNAGGKALTIEVDQINPVTAGIFYRPTNTNPTSCAVGDITMISGGVVRVCTTTTPTWNDVAGFLSVTTGVTAFAGGGQASATAICASAAQTTVATVASAGDSVKFPATPVVGQICRVKNKGANSLNLFPGSGDAICNSGSACGAADAALAVAANAQVDCYAESTATWNCK